MKKFLYCILFLLIFSLLGEDVQAQCAMCRSSLESNVSNGDVAVSAQLNVGILYLLTAPYLLFSLMAFFWYRASKKNSSGRKMNPLAHLKH